MSQALMRVRMTVTIDQCNVVLELLRDEVYSLPADKAAALIRAGSAVPEPSPKRLEAAALAAPTRRG